MAGKDEKPRSIVESVDRYERWLGEQVQVVEKDLKHKRKKIAKDAFVFLRGTYFRWAETIETLCPLLLTAPPVLAVGDVHLENFGVWRDAEGRLAWGISDFDEAARMPYAFDLVRLGASAVLAWDPPAALRGAMCAAILAGYRKRLGKPSPFILDEKFAWMRWLAMANDKERRDFWREIDEAESDPTTDKAYRRCLRSALPADAEIVKFAPRRAGVGSLGRPRFIVVAKWRGGHIVREAKALVPSAWTIRKRGPASRSNCATLSAHPYRSPDPHHKIVGRIAVRRLAPDSRKLDVEAKSTLPLQRQLLTVMGEELANVHAATPGAAVAIAADLERRDPVWLDEAVGAAVQMTAQEFVAWREVMKE